MDLKSLSQDAVLAEMVADRSKLILQMNEQLENLAKQVESQNKTLAEREAQIQSLTVQIAELKEVKAEEAISTN